MCDQRDFIAHPGHRKEPQPRARAERLRDERTAWRKNLVDVSRSEIASPVIATTAGYRSVSPAVSPDWEKAPRRAKAKEGNEIARHDGTSQRRGRSSREKYARRRDQRRLFERPGESDRHDSDDMMWPEFVCSGNSRVAYDRDLAGKRRIWCFNMLASNDLPYEAAESAGVLKEERSMALQRSVPEEDNQYKKLEECRSPHVNLRRYEELEVAESPRLRRCFPRPFGRLTKLGRAKTGRVHAAPLAPKHVAPSPKKSGQGGPRDEGRIHTEEKRENKQLRHQQSSEPLDPAKGASSKIVNNVVCIPRSCGLQTRAVGGDGGRKPPASEGKKQADKKLGRVRRRLVEGMCIPNLGALEWDGLEIIRCGPGSRPHNLLRNRNALDYPSTALARLATCNILGCIPY